MTHGANGPEKPFLEALAQGVLVVDGAMGTQLYERGVLYSACFEELNLSRPELVKKIHDDYLRAGAQVIATNTFGANSLRLEKHGLSARVADINEAAVRIARDAGRTSPAISGRAVGSWAIPAPRTSIA
jgi:homocysteine S-methyltransferase